MQKLYCGSCSNYLMGGDGECHDCPCGWKQPVEPREEDRSVDDSDFNRVMRAFLEEHWSLWEDHCESQGEDPQLMYEAIGGEPE